MILSGVDVEAFDEKKEIKLPTRKDLRIPLDAVVIGMVGRLCRQKAPDVFLQAAKRIKKKVDNAFFVIVGNGPMENEARKYAEENDLTDCLLITGWVTNPMDYVRQFDVSVLLSRWEGFGLVIPESMMAGKPVVASKVDVIPELIRDHENGLLVSTDDPDEASRAILKLMKDEKLRGRLVENGLKDAHDRFNARRMAKEHEILLEELV